MQEQIDRESIAVTVKASKITAHGLAVVLKKTAQAIKKHHEKPELPAQGKQSVKKLMNHNVPTSTIPIEGDKGLFEKVARKWHVDYAFHKTGENKYLLLFKAGQSDAITGAFAEYGAEVVKRAKDKRPPIRDEMKKAATLAEKERPKHKERTLKKEVVRE